MKEFITGAELMKLWKKSKPELMELFVVVKRCAPRNNITLKDIFSFNKALTPYHPAYLKPYECSDALIRNASKRYASVFGYEKYIPPAWSVEHPGDLYDKLPEVLFRKCDVDALLSKFPSNNQNIVVRSEVAKAIAKKLHQDDKAMTLPEAIKAINSYLEESKLEKYSEKQLRRIIKEVEFPPGKRGRQPKK